MLSQTEIIIFKSRFHHVGSSWCRLGVVLGSFWGRFVVVLGSSWDRLGVVPGSFWGHLGVILGSLWGHFFGTSFQKIVFSSKVTGSIPDDFSKKKTIPGEVESENANKNKQKFSFSLFVFFPRRVCAQCPHGSKPHMVSRLIFVWDSLPPTPIPIPSVSQGSLLEEKYRKTCFFIDFL